MTERGDTEDRLLRFWHGASRYAIVTVAVLGLFCLSVIPMQAGGIDDIRPPFLLMAIYYWTIFRPRLLSPVAVFLIGLVIDLVTALPLGMTALVFTAVQWVTRTQRKFLIGQSFIVIWWGFLLMAFAAALLHWGLFCLLHFTLMPVQPVLMGALLGVCTFPLVALPLYLVHRMLAALPQQGSAI